MLLPLALAFFLGGCDSNLTGVPFIGAPDYQQAQERYVRAAQSDTDAERELLAGAMKGEPASAFYAGLLIDPGRTGRTDRGDYEQAARFYESASKAYSGAAHNLALVLLTAGRPEEAATALTLLEQSAAKGRLESMLLAAKLLDNGMGTVAPNPAKAVDWYEKAVTTFKDPRAELELGKAFLFGRGRTADTSKALLYLTAAAKGGMVEAQYRMAGLAKSDSEAAQWLVIAATFDPRYRKDATAAVTQFTQKQQLSIERNAEMWVHAHGSEVQDALELGTYTLPLAKP